MLLESRELLLCHVTGQRHWDLPKGGIHAGETPIDAALRETHEETGLRLGADALLDIGRHAYTSKKDLHLFACLSQRIDPRELHCPSTLRRSRLGPIAPGDGRLRLVRASIASSALCTPKLAALLTRGLDLAARRRAARRARAASRSPPSERSRR